MEGVLVSLKEHDAVSANIAAERERAIQLSLDLHADPELSLEEHRAAQRLQAWLEEEGFVIEREVAGLPTAFVARHGQGRPAIAYLVEYDALPGLGHACGHNLIAAGGALAAVTAKRSFPDHPGTIVVIGTPGEEDGGGKIIELDHGVFEGIDAALMFHPADRTLLWRHAVAAGELTVQFHGVAAHAAKNPESGRNALNAMLLLFHAIDSLRQHIGEKALIHGIITHGGTAANVVPDFTEASLLVRDVTVSKVEDLIDRVKACAEGAAIATGTRTSVLVSPQIYAERKNNRVLAGRLGEHLDPLGVSHEEPDQATPAGSSDIGNVSLVLPTIHPYLAVAPRGTPSHSTEFQAAVGSPQAQERMVLMAEALARLGIDLLGSPTMVETAWREFHQSGPDLAGGHGPGQVASTA